MISPKFLAIENQWFFNHEGLIYDVITEKIEFENWKKNLQHN